MTRNLYPELACVGGISAGLRAWNGRPVSELRTLKPRTQVSSGVIVVLALALWAAGVGAQDAVAQDTVDLTGTWLLQVDTAAGSGSPTFTFKQNGEKLEGTYEGTFGKANVTGKVNGNKATWSFTADAQGTQLHITYSATVEEDTMKGTVTLGELGEGTFTGNRK